jgi:hypothetical protein
MFVRMYCTVYQELSRFTFLAIESRSICFQKKKRQSYQDWDQVRYFQGRVESERWKGSGAPVGRTCMPVPDNEEVNKICSNFCPY